MEADRDMNDVLHHFKGTTQYNRTVLRTFTSIHFLFRDVDDDDHHHIRRLVTKLYFWIFPQSCNTCLLQSNREVYKMPVTRLFCVKIGNWIAFRQLDGWMDG